MAQTGKSSDRCSGSAVSKNTLMYKKERIFFFFYRELQTYGKKLGLTSEPIVEFSYFDKKKKNDDSDS